MDFPWALVWSKTQIASFKIWTRVTDSISYYDNRYVKRESQKACFKSIQLISLFYNSIGNYYSYSIQV